MYNSGKEGLFPIKELPGGGRYLPLSSRAQREVPAGALLALGCFDGLHPGHRSLLCHAAALAKKEGRLFGVWSPAGAKNVGLLLPFEDKMEQLRALSVDFYLEEDFETIKDLSGKQFFEDYLICKYRAGALACGENFTFGRGGREGAEELGFYARQRGILLFVEEMKSRGDTPYSSALVRRALSAGAPEQAAALLGGPYGFSATVVKGRQVGRGLGFPTANLTLPKDSPLKPGVYGAEVWVAGERFPALANVGVHPTFEVAAQPLCEAHLLKDPQTDLYGQRVAISFLFFLREERQFSSPEELKEQISRDLLAAESLFAEQ